MYAIGSKYRIPGILARRNSKSTQDCSFRRDLNFKERFPSLYVMTATIETNLDVLNNKS